MNRKKEIKPITKMTNEQLDNAIEDLWEKIVEFSEAREELLKEKLKRLGETLRMV